METQTHHFNSLESTQDWAKEHFSSLDHSKFHVISANRQTKGRGRLDRHWHSPEGTGAYITYCFFIKMSLSNLSSISLMTGVTIAEALQKLGLTVKLKWPNDIFINEKKAGGILIETKPFDQGHVVFVGFGLNVNTSAEDLSPIGRPATSLYIETEQVWDIPTVVEPIETIFKRNLDTFLKQGFKAFEKDFENIAFLNGKKIIISHGKDATIGHYQGVDSSGALLLKLADGQIKAFASGEIISWE